MLQCPQPAQGGGRQGSVKPGDTWEAGNLLGWLGSGWTPGGSSPDGHGVGGRAELWQGVT